MVDANRNRVAGESILPSLDRTIVHLDFDEYRIQVEGLENPQVRQWSQQGVPIIVAAVHKKRIIAINYRARQLLGITWSKENKRSVDELQNQYGHLGLKIHYPETRYGREDMFTPEKYMNQVINVLESYRKSLRNKKSITMERIGLEEFDIDVTKLVNQRAGKNGLNIPFESRLSILCDSKKTHPNQNYSGNPVTVMEMADKRIDRDELRASVLKFQELCLPNEMQLVHGGCIAAAILRVIYSATKLQASAGVGHTKELARRACLLNKPEGVTIFSYSSLRRLSPLLKIEDIHGYGSGLAVKLDAEFTDQYGYGRLSTVEDVMKLGERAVVVLEDLFEKVEYPDKQKSPQAKAEELVRLCHGNDGKDVQESLDKKTMETTEHIPEGLTPDEFKVKSKNLAKDFAGRIEFLKNTRGRTPKIVRMKISTRCDAEIPWKNMKVYCPGWSYIFNFILNRIRYLQLDIDQVQEIKLTAIYT